MLDISKDVRTFSTRCCVSKNVKPKHELNAPKLTQTLTRVP